MEAGALDDQVLDVIARRAIPPSGISADEIAKVLAVPVDVVNRVLVSLAARRRIRLGLAFGGYRAYPIPPIDRPDE